MTVKTASLFLYSAKDTAEDTEGNAKGRKQIVLGAIIGDESHYSRGLSVS